MIKELLDKRIIALTAVFFVLVITMVMLIPAYAIYALRGEHIGPLIIMIFIIMYVVHSLSLVYYSACSYMLILKDAGLFESVKKVFILKQVILASPIIILTSLGLWMKLMSSEKIKWGSFPFTDFPLISQCLLLPIMSIENKNRNQAEEKISQVLILNHEELRKTSVSFTYLLPIFIFACSMILMLFLGYLVPLLPANVSTYLFPISIISLVFGFMYFSSVGRMIIFSEKYMETLYLEKKRDTNK